MIVQSIAKEIKVVEFHSPNRKFFRCGNTFNLEVVSLPNTIILAVFAFEQLHNKPQGPTQSVWVADCYFIVNVLDLPFASPIAIYR